MTSRSATSPVVYNHTWQRFELMVEGEVAFAHCTREGRQVVFDHTFVPEASRGKGVAEVLVRAVLDEARRQRWRIVPQCSYVAAFIERNPAYADLVDQQV